MAFILPFIVLGWAVITLLLGVVALIHAKIQGHRSPLVFLPFKLGSISLLSAFILWPPWWLVRSTYQANTPVSEQVNSSELPPIHLLSWNLQRMGELALKNRTLAKKRKLACVTNAIRRIESKSEYQVDLFALQEVSNSGIRELEKALDLDCQFISYQQGGRAKAGGLGVCHRKQGRWHINYARNISMSSEGQWRALFAEVSMKDGRQETFNLINVHFLPHHIGLRRLRGVLFSTRSVLDIVADIRTTSTAQRKQAARLLEVINSYRDPTILAGDFNAPPQVGAHPLMKTSWLDIWEASGTTFGATRYVGLLPFRVDYIYTLSNTFKPQFATVESTTCSDHLPLHSLLQLNVKKRAYQ